MVMGRYQRMLFGWKKSKIGRAHKRVCGQKTQNESLREPTSTRSLGHTVQGSAGPIPQDSKGKVHADSASWTKQRYPSCEIRRPNCDREEPYQSLAGPLAVRFDRSPTQTE